MITLLATTLLVPAIDESVKRWLRRARVRTVEGRLWLVRLTRPASRRSLWMLWGVAAVALAAATSWVPASQWAAGLILGGSLSNAIETSVRGRVTDYVDLGFWPAFNLADVALTAGGLGMAVALVSAIRVALA